MPSAAMTEGRAILDGLLPAGEPGPEATIRAYNGADGPGIAFTLHPTYGHSWGGEYRERVILPHAPGANRERALDRLRLILDRSVEMRAVLLDIQAERLACDVDGSGNEVDCDMPAAAWQIHCPMPLRLAMDEAGLGDGERAGLADDRRNIELRGYSVEVKDVTEERSNPLQHRSVTRIDIRKGAFHFSQGINRCYLKTGVRMPQTTLAALAGRPVSALVDAPGLAHTGIQIIGLESSSAKEGDVLAITRSFAMMATPPSLRSPT